jgi:hypothetical protein
MKTTMMIPVAVYFMLMSCSSAKHLSANYSDDVYNTSPVSKTTSDQSSSNYYYSDALLLLNPLIRTNLIQKNLIKPTKKGILT